LVRLLWREHHRLDFVGLDLSQQARISVKQGFLVSAIHSVKGDVTFSLRYSDDKYVELLPGENIELKFIVIPRFMSTRDYVFTFEGHYFTIS
jgi:hypothetical protein